MLAAAETPAALPIMARMDARASDEAATDLVLLTAFAGGDAQAFAQLYARHERPVYRFLRRSLQDGAAAEDLLQEVWLAVMRNAASFEPRAKFTTWLFAIARSKLIDHWRSRKEHVAFDDRAANDPDDGGPAMSLADRLPAEPREQPEVRFENRAQARAFLVAVEQLPAVQREAFLLHVEGDMTVEEVARATGVGRETAKSRLRYAMRRLRELLEDWR
jgi:RNA polymerase sigma-70 factor (ECF subfamily)